MLSSPAAWVTTVPTPTICTTYYECGPTPGPRAWQCKLRGVHRLPVFSPSIEKDQVQRLRCVQSALCGADVRRRSPSRPLRRACGDHGGTHDGVAGGAHSSVGMPRPGRRPARPTPGGAGGAQALVAGDTGVGTTRPTTFGGPCYRRRTHLAISGLTCLCACATPVFRIEGFDHGPRGNLLGLCCNGLCDGRAGNRSQTTLLLQEPRLLRGYGVHGLDSPGLDGLCRLEGLAPRRRPASDPGDAEYPGGMPGHLLHPRFHSRTLPTLYTRRCHDAPAQASDRMAPYPGTVRVPRMAGRQFWCGRPVDARIRRRRRGVPHKGLVRGGHTESPGYDPTCSRHERSFERDTAHYARCGAQALRTPGRDPVRRCPGIENMLGRGLEITRPQTSDCQVCATARCAKGSTRTCR